MSAPSLDYDTILRVIRKWPKDAQVELAREILREAEDNRKQQPSDTTPSSSREDSFRQLIGILATDQPAPSDEEIERWREERRMEKYGH
ncbi:MAG TPA: hypothetical protein VFX31_04350 [Ktedonobacterales bacterium]|jgi:hypothetical protein|nr:hypothetical protein [Ktedonobacterales bacterium]HEX5570594.1 hypothetical protein [Ktedonobacterales bacterium]